MTAVAIGLLVGCGGSEEPSGAVSTSLTAVSPQAAEDQIVSEIESQIASIGEDVSPPPPTAAQIVSRRLSIRWPDMTPQLKLQIAQAWLKGPGRAAAAAGVGAKALVRETNADTAKGLSTDQGTAGQIFRFPAELVLSEASFRAKKANLGPALVGSSMAQVRDLIGEPEDDQLIAGQAYWYYSLEGNRWQLVFSGDTVSQVNKY